MLSDDSTGHGRLSCPCASAGPALWPRADEPEPYDLGGLLHALEHLEHHGQIGRGCGEDVLAVVVEDEVGVEVAWSDR